MWLLRRLLESQLQSQKRSHENEAEALRGEIQSLKEENNRQQQLLAQNLQLPPEARIEASLQHEITRLTNENLVRTAEKPSMLLEQNLLPGWGRCRSLPNTYDPLSLVQTHKENTTMLVEVKNSCTRVVCHRRLRHLSAPQPLLGGCGRCWPAVCWGLDTLRAQLPLLQLHSLCHPGGCVVATTFGSQAPLRPSQPLLRQIAGLELVSKQMAEPKRAVG